MTGGSFDVNGGNLLLYGNYGNAATTATVDISGDAQLRNIAYLYVHNKYDKYRDTSLSVNIHDGGTLGFQMAKHSGTSCIPNVYLNVDGGTLVNEYYNKNASKASLREWISELGAASFKVGPKGATFMPGSGAKSGTAQIRIPIAAEAAGAVAAGMVAAAGTAPAAVRVEMDFRGVGMDMVVVLVVKFHILAVDIVGRRERILELVAALDRKEHDHCHEQANACEQDHRADDCAGRSEGRSVFGGRACGEHRYGRSAS
jgi:hypothetical protein